MKARTTVTLEKDLLRRAKVRAAATDRSLSDLLEEALRAALETPIESRRPFKLKVFEGSQGLAPGVREEDFLSPWELIGRLERGEVPGAETPSGR